ncbi:M20 family metallo-hydrolase [Gulosibacter chungangensis]|uniref:M20 family metallo-hydrolase n=1 Tax=Gulosibacter chungangensis TaxID=979746 RepID=A0A7J5BFL2_9MICO|nr:M20 family metallo-hydrolase [Gulosibacter chungangensis]KAB1645063.1 M20 family metallo-hydrolase [Gulosibacter chungangensis]
MTTQTPQFLLDFRSMSTIGATPGGGVDRQAATVADGQTRNWFRGLVEGYGFEVHYDQVGNQFALLELVPGAPYIAVGSHMDSQPLGGRFDGAYGVLAGAHAAKALAEERSDGAKFNLAVVNWFNEEGCRFKPSMMGSSVFTGKLPAEQVLETTDPKGVTVREALQAIGTIGDFTLDIAAYVEIHIEQGRSLDDSGVQIGVVESTWAANKYEYRVIGDQSHTGATVIADRKDALLGAAGMIVAARDVADQFTDEQEMVVTSCGEISVFPNSPVVVASEVQLLIDIRSTSVERLAEADAELIRRFEAAAERADVVLERGKEHIWGANEYDAKGQALAAAAADSLGLSHSQVRTLAGHDSTNLKDMVPTIMLFVPSVDGITHNEKEFTKDEDMLAGVSLLTEVLRRVTAGELVEAK